MVGQSSHVLILYRNLSSIIPQLYITHTKIIFFFQKKNRENDGRLILEHAVHRTAQLIAQANNVNLDWFAINCYSKAKTEWKCIHNINKLVSIKK